MAGYLETASADQIATSTTRHTILQIGTPAAVAAAIVAIDITFDGTSPLAVPVLVLLEQQASAGTGGVALVTGYGPNPFDTITPATTITALKGPWATTEPVMSKVLKAWRISPTSGLSYMFSLDQEPVCPASGFMGVTVTAAATVNATCNLVWRRGP